MAESRSSVALSHSVFEYIVCVFLLTFTSHFAKFSHVGVSQFGWLHCSVKHVFIVEESFFSQLLADILHLHLSVHGVDGAHQVP